MRKEDMLCVGAMTAPTPNATDAAGSPLRATPHWPYWSDLHGSMEALPMERRRMCFMPWRRMSRAAMRLLSDEVLGKKSWGFVELYLPTLLNDHNLTVSNISPQSLGQVGVMKRGPQMDAVREKMAAGPPDGKWYHPIKDP